ncbi:NIPSNAP family containing protein [Mucilaginibacter hurinus]|uniref:NIPSNAP family containing protein n=1 Tax=Mucilaginibacter hurinus TaxID=2201324 RepID=A0A367GNR8_9SPHI|nr:NIPSNAP family protein [Mucilaginibacter hurinus]RCH55134.1 NIPSNAP family containing protein [Mucilaginibacter hurinus]
MKFKALGTLISAIFLSSLISKVYGGVAKGDFYQVKVYHYKTASQFNSLQHYLKDAYLPALHRNGIKHAGVFNTMHNDTVDRRIYVFIPFKNLNDIELLDAKLSKDAKYKADAKDYLDAPHDTAPYSRLEVILLKAFAGMPQPAVPALSAPKSGRIYELRSYESATEKYHINKVSMFNEGDEIGIFSRLGFNAVFYGSVISGHNMPNLMYMTAFANKDERDKHWNEFIVDAAWKTLSAKPEYKNNVSHIDITFLQAAEYSDF